MPSAADVRSFVANALDSKHPENARPWRDSLAGEDKDPASLTLLGRLCANDGDNAAALAFIGEALRVDPYYIEGYLQRGNILLNEGAFSQALRTFETILLFAPLHDETLLTLYRTAEQANAMHIAIGALNRRLRLTPNAADYFNLLGLALHKEQDIYGAMHAYQQAVNIAPQTPLFHNNLATVFYHLDRFNEALSELEYALQLDPDFAIAWQNVGNVQKELRRSGHAEEAYRRAIALSPDYAEPHFNLGCVLLQTDRWQEGWAEYEWRWRVPGLVAPIHAGVPLWNGEDLNGKRIMIVAEQGSGDTIQFVRYARTLVDRGAEVVIWAPVETASLLRRLPHISQVATNRAEFKPCDYFAPMMSLPRILGSALDRIPSAPYLTCDARRQAAFLRELGPRQENLRIGLAWAGNPGQVHDRHRSAPLEALGSLFDDPSIRWISLQKGEAQQQIGPSRLPLEDWSSQLDTFDSTAALMGALDGVVSICSGPLHLAGALGIRSIGLLPHAADWRWRDEETRTIWYPSMTIIRQSSYHAWDEVAKRAAEIVSTWKPKAMPRNLT